MAIKHYSHLFITCNCPFKTPSGHDIVIDFYFQRIKFLFHPTTDYRSSKVMYNGVPLHPTKDMENVITVTANEKEGPLVMPEKV